MFQLVRSFLEFLFGTRNGKSDQRRLSELSAAIERSNSADERALRLAERSEYYSEERTRILNAPDQIEASLACAIRDLDEVVSLIPSDGWYHKRRGDLYARKGDSDNAFADYATAITLEPNGSAFEARASLHRRLGNFTDVILDCTAGLSLVQPGSPTFHRLLAARAEAHESVGESAKAATDRASLKKSRGW